MSSAYLRFAKLMVLVVPCLAVVGCATKAEVEALRGDVIRATELAQAAQTSAQAAQLQSRAAQQASAQAQTEAAEARRAGDKMFQQGLRK
ncbi:MAG: hypothetical protein H7840_15740 [Alphaproteobacteria bacterium]